MPDTTDAQKAASPPLLTPRTPVTAKEKPPVKPTRPMVMIAFFATPVGSALIWGALMIGLYSERWATPASRPGGSGRTGGGVNGGAVVLLVAGIAVVVVGYIATALALYRATKRYDLATDKLAAL